MRPSKTSTLPEPPRSLQFGYSSLVHTRNVSPGARESFARFFFFAPGSSFFPRLTRISSYSPISAAESPLLTSSTQPYSLPRSSRSPRRGQTALILTSANADAVARPTKAINRSFMSIDYDDKALWTERSNELIRRASLFRLGGYLPRHQLPLAALVVGIFQ